MRRPIYRLALRLLRQHPAERRRDLWFQEEARAERLSNFIRLIYIFVWLISTSAHAPGNHFWSNVANLGLGSAWFAYALGLQIVLAFRPYRREIKYVSTGIDIGVTAGMLYLYHFTGGAAFALKVPSALNLFCVQGLAALRFQRGLALFAGGLAVGLYLVVMLLVLRDPGTVLGSPLEHTQSAAISPLYLLYNVLYLIVFALLIYFLVVNVRRLVVLRVKETQAAHQAKERALVAAGVAHEIKNPLGGIYGAAQLLKEEGKGNARFIDMILKDSVRLNEVVQQFLRFSRPFEARMSAFDLSATVSEFVQAQNAVNGAGYLTLEGGEVEIPVQADPEGLGQILLNLTQNARRFHPAGRPVVVRLRSEDEVALVEVEDEGEGVSAENRTKLFEPFFTTAARGTGLGLAISRKVAREMGGNLYYEPKDPGSRFVVVLKTPGTDTAEDDENDPEA